jgi:hypothetical protein
MTELAEAASSGLDVFTEPATEQQVPLVPVCKVKFNGLQFDSMEKLPDLKESLRFEIEGYVVGHGQMVLANGEVQDLATVKVTRVVPKSE